MLSDDDESVALDNDEDLEDNMQQQSVKQLV
jgi:hypothetical protein